MGYAGFSLKNFSLALSPSAVFTLRRGPQFWLCERANLFMGRELTLFSAFLEPIVVQPFAFGDRG
jgi:hypothetical protein